MNQTMKLSIVILCWNDREIISNCLQSIFSNTHSIDFEVIVSDNGSTDGSPQHIRASFPTVRVLENGANLRFAKGNNVAIREARGEYVLILNPDTIIHDGTLDKLIAFADRHPEAGAFGCRVLNPDGTYQESARPFPTLLREWVLALHLKPLGYLADCFQPGTYMGWHGDTETTVDWLSGCSMLVRANVLKSIGGFDEQFFYYYEDTDLCRQVWESGYSILFCPEMTIIHLGGQSTKRFPLAFLLDSQVTRYRYFYKYFGASGVRHCRWIALASLLVRRLGYGVANILKPGEAESKRLEALRMAFQWNSRVDPVRLIENGEEPTLEVQPAGRVLAR